MTRDNKDGWKTKVGQECEDSDFNSIPRGVGTLSTPSTKTRNEPFGTRRANSDQSNTFTINLGAGTAGGMASQLIEETQKQLAYHKTQVSELEERLHELQQFTEDLKSEDHE
ncbi:hypothetical protein [Nostoc sp.]|uniref:hypothetical protein n=1 Tax=Nostoc sp. TaxID=1180 RepID=UPI002FFB10A9